MATACWGTKAYLQAAEQAADFVLAKLRDPGGRLLRTYCAGQAKLSAYLEDYAFLIHGLIRLHAATGKPRWLEQARTLADRMIADFADPKEGGFFFTAGDHESLLARPKDPLDGALPGANSMAVLDLLAVHQATGETRYRDAAGKSLEFFSTALAQNRAAMPMMLVALQRYLDGRPNQIIPRPLGEGALAKVPSRVVTASAMLERGTSAVPGRALERRRQARGQERLAPLCQSDRGRHLETDDDHPRCRSAGGSAPSSTYPAGQAKVLGSLGKEKVSLYEGKLDIPVRVALSPETPKGKITLMFKLKYQACDDKVCLAPASLTIPLELVVDSPSASVESKP